MNTTKPPAFSLTLLGTGTTTESNTSSVGMVIEGVLTWDE